MVSTDVDFFDVPLGMTRVGLGFGYVYDGLTMGVCVDIHFQTDILCLR